MPLAEPASEDAFEFCGGGGSRTRVRRYHPMNVYARSLLLNFTFALQTDKLVKGNLKKDSRQPHEKRNRLARQTAFYRTRAGVSSGERLLLIKQR